MLCYEIYSVNIQQYCMIELLAQSMLLPCLHSASMSCFVIYIQLISLGKFNVSLKVYIKEGRDAQEGFLVSWMENE